MNDTATMTTFEIKMTVLTILGENSTLAKAEDLYKWVMEELDTVEKTSGTVQKLHTVN